MIVKGAYIFHRGRLDRKDILINMGKIENIADDIGGDDSFDATGLLVLPGIRNCHMHASTSLIMGAPINGGLDDWVGDVLWKYEKDITEKEAHYGALYSICQMLRSGITYFEDMHFHELEVLKACEASGIRASLSEALMDLNEWGDTGADIRSSIGLAKRARRSPLVDAKIGIVSVRLASEELIDELVRTGRDNPGLFSGFHLHLNEVRQDAEHSMSAYGVLPTRFFADKGVLGNGTTIAHCIHMDGNEMDVLAQSGARVALCPASNMRLCSGIAPAQRMRQNGVRLSLGIDSPAISDGFDLFMDARLLGLVNEMAPADVLGVLFGDIEPRVGTDADLIFLNMGRNLPRVWNEPFLAYGANGGAVEHVMVGGRMLVVGGELTTIDEEKVYKKALSLSERAVSRLEL